MDGFTAVTDPVFGNRAGFNLGPVTVGIKRLVEPAAALDRIPHPDLILLSHAHMDHFDLPTLRRLENRATSVVTAANTSDLLRVPRYGDVREIAWGERTRIGPATITAFAVKHWGARMQSDTQRGYNGYVLEAGKFRVLFGGDTALTNTFRALRGMGKIDLAIMPVGAYNPWIAVHCNPEQAVSMANDAAAEFLLPVHNQTFVLSDEPLHEPIERLLEAAHSEPGRICLTEIGQEFHLR
jgi:L-ascorbate metabolism protein UlaG (beta-lactamase superfamily)